MNAARLIAADSEPGQWMSHGRTYDEQRFSPLDQITKDNVKELGLAWFADLDTNRGQEATPIVVDGVLYVSTAWSKVKAVNAATGQQLWAYDPVVPGGWAVNACCDVVNRGVAVWDGKVFVGTIDGRLVALDAATGKPLWDVNTIDKTKPYTITGAPRVVKGKVLIGNGGAELGVRGYVSAYDASTGATGVAVLHRAGQSRERLRDPDLERPRRRGAGSGGRSAAAERSGIRCPTTRSSICSTSASATALPGITRIAARARGQPVPRVDRGARSGRRVVRLALPELAGRDVGPHRDAADRPGRSRDRRHQAPRRHAGAEERVLLRARREDRSADFREEHHRCELGDPHRSEDRPSRRNSGGAVRQEQANHSTRVRTPTGVHTWHSMSFNPQTGLVYIPIHSSNFMFGHDARFKPQLVGTNLGVDFLGNVPANAKAAADALASAQGRLIAWDPVAQKEVWRVERAGPANGGALTTAGGLVFQGTGMG